MSRIQWNAETNEFYRLRLRQTSRPESGESRASEVVYGPYEQLRTAKQVRSLKSRDLSDYYDNEWSIEVTTGWVEVDE